MRRALIFVFAVVFFFAPSLFAEKPSLLGSHESQARQNEEALREGLERVLNDARLNRMKKDGTLVELPTHKYLEVDPRVPPKFRFCLPEVKTFLLDLASNPRRTGKIKITSAVRTDVYQRELRKKNPNAVPLSSHVFGCTVDITKLKHSKAELKVLRKFLLELEGAGLIEATEETRQSVFHIMVFKKYLEHRSVPGK